ncbi:MAG: UDP-N-acetylglucosamine 2-epimerase (non-hydrolyzing) [bacterium]|nr:UDP-N-acetylglucosamine 2-epimerase (non-hydrolyzing) [bacterium]
MKHICIVIGTRPEAIKLAPVIRALRKEEIKTTVCVFRQHGKMLDETLRALEIKPDTTFPISISDRMLGKGSGLIQKAITGLQSGLGILRYMRFLKNEKPDMVIVQGDTLTAFLAAFLAFLTKTPVAHVEAGLRTYDKFAPFPEEINRQLIARIADIHFAPTESAKQNLLREGIQEKNIYVVGNTAIDTLLSVAKSISSHSDPPAGGEESHESGKKTILVTAHRRESFGEGLKEICSALKEIAEKRPDVKIIFLVHPNPNVEKVVRSELRGVQNIELCAPLPYTKMVEAMKASYLILTDSGGIQEEAPSLGKPVLVMREKTERQEGIEAGVSKLVGVKKEVIVAGVLELLENKEVYEKMATGKNPYGDGKASERIVEILLR